MGFITPNRSTAVAVKKVASKKVLVDCAIELLNEEEEDEEGVMRTNAMQIMRRLVRTAKYAESNKDAIQATNTLLAYSVGKPAIIADEKEEEITPVVLRVHPKDKALLEEIAANGELDEPTQEELDSDIEVRIDGDDAVLRFH